MSVPDFDMMPNNGVTPLGYFRVGYDQNNWPNENGRVRAQNFYPFADGIYTFLQAFFPGVTLPGTPIQVLVTTIGLGAGFGASWHSTSDRGGSFDVYLSPSDDMENLQSLLVLEVSEIFMLQQGKGWFAGSGTEGEIGEALSAFLAREWGLVNGYSGGGIGNTWMTSNRPDTLNDVDPKPDYSVKVAGDMLFLTFLKYQLGFSTNEIIAAGDPSKMLTAVYKNLTTDTNDPFNLFKSLLDYKYPGQTAVPNDVDQDCPWPIGMLSFTFNKNTYKKDEVHHQLHVNGGLFPDEFSVDIVGFNMRVLQGNTKITLTLETFPDVAGFPQDMNKIDHPIANNDIPQKVSYWFGVQFKSIAHFPHLGLTITKKLTANFTLLQKPNGVGAYSSDPAVANLEFVGCEDEDTCADTECGKRSDCEDTK